MYPTSVSPPLMKAEPSPPSPRIGRSSYSLPPSNGEERLFSQANVPPQSQTVSQGSKATKAQPPAQKSTTPPQRPLLHELSNTNAFEMEISARAIQQSFRKSPGYQRFRRQEETRKRIAQNYGTPKKQTEKKSNNQSSSKEPASSLKNQDNNNNNNNNNNNSSSSDSNEEDSRQNRGRRNNEGGRNRNRSRNRNRKRSRRRDDFSDDSSNSSEESGDSSDSYDDRRRSKRRHHTRHHSRNRRRKQGGRKHRRNDSSSDGEDEDSGQDTKRRDRRSRRDRNDKSSSKNSKNSKKSKKSKKSKRGKENNTVAGPSMNDIMAEAATKIQTMFRSRFQRYVWENITYPALIRWRQQTSILAENLVSELLEDEVIPDVLIEIFSHAGDVDDPFAPNPDEDRHVWAMWSDIVNEVIADLGDGLCRQVIQSFVNGYLQTRREAEQISPDPVAIVIEDIVGEVADDVAKQLVGECITEMVQSYLRQQTADDFLNTTLQPLIAEVAHLAMDDLEVDNIVENMIEEYILNTSQEVASESFLEMKDIILGERQRRQYSEVSEAAERIFDNTSLRMLVRTMATNAESILMRDYMNRLASGMLVRTIFAKLQRVQQHDNSMLMNRPMRHFHQEVTSRIAIHQMLAMLPAQLDKDEADIDERENLDGFSLDEEKEKADVAIRIQAKYRGRAQRLAVKKKEQKEQENAALIIQAR